MRRGLSRSHGRVRGMLPAVCGLLVLALFGWQRFASAQSDRGVSVQKTAATKSTAHGVEEKLDTILANQEAILKKLEALQEEVQIVKVRCTR